MKRIISFAAILAASLLVFACGQKNEPDPAPIIPTLTFTAEFDAGTSGFKDKWNDKDIVELYAEKNGKGVNEPLRVSNISADGKTATIKTAGVMPENADFYYAIIRDCGATGFKDLKYWKVGSMSRMSGTPMPAIVAKTAKGSTKMTFTRLYSTLNFNVKLSGAAYVVLKGNDSEVVNRDNLVAFSDYSSTENPNPSFSSSTSLKTEIDANGNGCFCLYPGLSFTKGYTLTAYNANGSTVGQAKTEDALTIAKGSDYSAPEFKEGKEEKRTKTFDPSRIVLSLANVSDCHVNGSGTDSGLKFKSALTQLQKLAKTDDTDGIDAVLVAGDLIDNAYTDAKYYSQCDDFKTVYESVFDPESVPMIYTPGNHDVYKQWTSSTISESQNISTRLGSKYFTADLDMEAKRTLECRHCRVGNLNILCIVPNGRGPVSYPSEAISWLDGKLKEITSETPDRYVYVLTHPMIYDTVYGSLLGPDWLFGQCTDYWYTKALTEVLVKYPQAVVFGGHLHFPINDPRSIWQGDFTVFGCGSVRYMAIEDGKYESMSSTTVMRDANEVSSGLLTQIDASGNIRITKMFFSQETTFGQPWEICYPQTDGSHLAKYNHSTLKAANEAPVMSFLDIKKGTSGVTVNFNSGKDDEFVHHYVIIMKKDGTAIETKRVLADFYKHPEPSGMKESWSLGFGVTEKGSYEVTVQAFDSWDAESNILSKTFTID